MALPFFNSLEQWSWAVFLNKWRTHGKRRSSWSIEIIFCFEFCKFGSKIKTECLRGNRSVCLRENNVHKTFDATTWFKYIHLKRLKWASKRGWFNEQVHNISAAHLSDWSAEMRCKNADYHHMAAPYWIVHKLTCDHCNLWTYNQKSRSWTHIKSTQHIPRAASRLLHEHISILFMSKRDVNRVSFDPPIIFKSEENAQAVLLHLALIKIRRKNNWNHSFERRHIQNRMRILCRSAWTLCVHEVNYEEQMMLNGMNEGKTVPNKATDWKLVKSSSMDLHSLRPLLPAPYGN